MDAGRHAPVRSAAGPWLGGVSAAIPKRIGRALGLSEKGRQQVVAGMRRKPADDRIAYWLQLLLATGIATFGLELDSPGIVIAAMLIAPLMAPIVELAMSLVIGDAAILVHAFARVVSSVVAVSGTAALMAAVLPFKVASAEILARTSPTLLDLGVAVLCAIAAGFTTVRASTAAASTAAGASIGISLVPPLCVAGFGLGVGNLQVSEGALLLFIANFSAILVCAGAFFALTGFLSIPPTHATEDLPGRQRGPLRHLTSIIEAGLHSPWRIVWRVGVPLALLAAVSIPLTHALGQVAWQVRTRMLVNQTLASEAGLREAVSLTTQVEPGRVLVRAVIVGDDVTAMGIEQRVSAQLATLAGVEPQVHVRAVLANEPTTRGRLQAAEPRDLTLAEAAGRLGARIEPVIAAAWPRDNLPGRPAASYWELNADGIALSTLHEGAPVAEGDRSALERRVSAQLGIPTRIQLVALAPSVPVDNDVETWWTTTRQRVSALETLPAEWRACVEIPPRSRVGRAVHDRIEMAIKDRQTALGAERVVIDTGPQWRLQVARECPAAIR